MALLLIDAVSRPEPYEHIVAFYLHDVTSLGS